MSGLRTERRKRVCVSCFCRDYLDGQVLYTVPLIYSYLFVKHPFVKLEKDLLYCEICMKKSPEFIIA